MRSDGGRTPALPREELLPAYEASGLTQSAFARREGINYTTFCSWALRVHARESVLQWGRARVSAERSWLTITSVDKSTMMADNGHKVHIIAIKGEL